LLEKADMSLDEFTGIVKRLSPPGEQVCLYRRPDKYTSNHSKAAAAKARTHPGDKKNINFPKPQLTFEHVPNNHETQGFRPLLTSKPHAMIPLDTCLKTFKDNKDREQ
jgi:exosome complex exonuclease RRP6